MIYTINKTMWYCILIFVQHFLCIIITNLRHFVNKKLSLLIQIYFALNLVWSTMLQIWNVIIVFFFLQKTPETDQESLHTMRNQQPQSTDLIREDPDQNSWNSIPKEIRLPSLPDGKWIYKEGLLFKVIVQYRWIVKCNIFTY